eukprot:1710491-Prorocentrum_lima.AAC.1
MSVLGWDIVEWCGVAIDMLGEIGCGMVKCTVECAAVRCNWSQRDIPMRVAGGTFLACLADSAPRAPE